MDENLKTAKKLLTGNIVHEEGNDGGRLQYQGGKLFPETSVVL